MCPNPDFTDYPLFQPEHHRVLEGKEKPLQFPAMSLQFQSLLYYPPDALAASFNEAFEHYFVPVQMDEKQLEQKMLNENIRLHLSVGAFSENKLAGFILTGLDEQGGTAWAYNAGTGVLPQWRGRGLTQAMYRFLFALLDERGVKRHVLEVIDQNEKAIHIYQQCGFGIKRGLACCKGKPAENKLPVPPGLHFDILPFEALQKAYQLGDSEPTWQNSLASVLRNTSAHLAVGAWLGKNLAAAAVMNPAGGRVKMFAVDKKFRNKGIGSALLQHVSASAPQGTVFFLNIDRSNETFLRFLEKRSITEFIGQQEMIVSR